MEQSGAGAPLCIEVVLSASSKAAAAHQRNEARAPLRALLRLAGCQWSKVVDTRLASAAADEHTPCYEEHQGDQHEAQQGDAHGGACRRARGSDRWCMQEGGCII